jgi:hypothetical protein
LYIFLAQESVFLQTLLLGQNLISDVGLRALLRVLAADPKELSTFGVGAHVSDGGAAMVSDWLRNNHTLTALRLGWNNIGMPTQTLKSCSFLRQAFILQAFSN